MCRGKTNINMIQDLVLQSYVKGWKLARGLGFNLSDSTKPDNGLREVNK